MDPTTSSSDLCLYMLAVFMPPLAVTLKAGCGSESLINTLLTLLGWLPGWLHAWYIISKKNEQAAQRRFMASMKNTDSSSSMGSPQMGYAPTGPPPMNNAPMDNPPMYKPPMDASN